MITLNVTEEEKERCYAFSTQIINGGNQFNRFNQNSATQILRTYIGKLGEYVFLHYLHSQGINYPEGDMFEIFPGAENCDSYDFVTIAGKSVDIKTASRGFHRRIMVPIDQFNAMPKDYYVGIKLNFLEVGGKISYDRIQTCSLYGYTSRTTLENIQTKNFGEGNCKAIELVSLIEISSIIQKFR